MSLHEWTDRLGKHWCAVGGADLPPQGADLIVSKEVGDEILRLAEENAVLERLRVRVETVTCADGYQDMTLAQMHGLVAGLAAEQVRPLEAERARLAEEVERLKVEVERLETADEAEFARGEEEGIAQERTRIRRELLAEIEPRLAALKSRNAGAGVDPLTIHDSACIGLLSELRRALDRIVPGEG